MKGPQIFTWTPDYIIQTLVQDDTGIHADVFRRVSAAYPYGVRLWNEDTGNTSEVRLCKSLDDAIYSARGATIWRPILLTAIFTGLRASELRGLRWVDLDLEKRELHVRQRADRYSKIGKPKSDAGERAVPLTPIVVNTLREWKLACPKNELGLVFPTTGGLVEHHKNIIERGLIPTLIAAGVTLDGRTEEGEVVKLAKYTGLHAFRHFYASWCINRRADGGFELPAKVVQERLGHSSIMMTMDVYGHLFPRGDDTAELAAAEKALIG